MAHPVVRAFIISNFEVQQTLVIIKFGSHILKLVWVTANRYYVLWTAFYIGII